MASNTVVLVTGLLTPLCTDFFAFSVRVHFSLDFLIAAKSVSRVLRRHAKEDQGPAADGDGL